MQAYMINHPMGKFIAVFARPQEYAKLETLYGTRASWKELTNTQVANLTAEVPSPPVILEE